MDKARLDSWKEIAAYLGRDVRTVSRWERQRGLPVYRVPGGRRSHVFAYAEELDGWLARGNGASTPAPPPPDPSPAPHATALPRQRWPLRALAGTLLVAAVAVLAGWALARAAGPPRQLSLVGGELVARDASGRTRWSYPFGTDDITHWAQRWSHIGDLDRDGREEVLVTVDVSGPGFDRRGSELLDFSTDGTLLWSAAFKDRLAFQADEFGAPWAASDLAVYRAGGETRIAWALHHFTWWPGVVVTFNVRGERVSTFVNAGWIQQIQAAPDGEHLLAVGVTNSRKAYFLAVLDGGRPTGHSPEDSGSAFECTSCAPEAPIAYWVFPRTDVGLEQTFPLNGPGIQTFPDGTVQVQTQESSGPNIAAAIFQFAPDLSLHSASFSDSYWEWHRQLARDGKLNHLADDCPDGDGLDVQRWTRADGWRSLRVAVR